MRRSTGSPSGHDPSSASRPTASEARRQHRDVERLGAEQVTPEEVELIVCDAVDVLGPEATEVVHRVAHELGFRRTGAELFDRWERHHPVSFADLDEQWRLDSSCLPNGAEP